MCVQTHEEAKGTLGVLLNHPTSYSLKQDLLLNLDLTDWLISKTHSSTCLHLLSTDITNLYYQSGLKKEEEEEPGVVVQTCNPITWKVEANRSL